MICMFMGVNECVRIFLIFCVMFILGVFVLVVVIKVEEVFMEFGIIIYMEKVI